jgi:enoyl-CoA hydratase/carnithine racemase
MDYNKIRLEQQGRIATLTLARPESGNTISDADTLAELLDALAGIEAAADLSVLILTGSGTIFSAGGNVRDMRDKAGMFAGEAIEVYENYRQSVQRLTLKMAGLDQVTIAAVNGAAVGAGCDLALMCDLRLAARSARFGQTFVNVGLIPGDGGLWFLARIVPRHVAADLVFTGRLVGADEALRLGLVNEVVEDAQLAERARGLAEAIAARPPLALRQAKRLLNRAYGSTLPDFLDLSAAYQAMLHQTDDHRQALAAYFEKRTG